MSIEQVAAMHRPGDPVGPAMKRILNLNKLIKEQEEKDKLPVKQRLGFHGPNRKWSNNKAYTDQKRFQSDKRWNSTNFKPAGFREVYKDFRVCDFCGIRGHLKRRCFKRKDLKREAIHLVDQMKPGTSGTQSLADFINTRRSEETDSDSDEGGNWKRSNKRPQESA
ncbi:uncharacterized protein LOC129724528 [Wyeomyia smithii]|uniref:uncharacterized protein LOC129724528 n=1 Tax=Wyeomyia smithii TaxID=174621 RepID=UPI002467BB67|nr:uncharacterized protein LOC129724528 [Wyeomyia smithii]